MLHTAYIKSSLNRCQAVQSKLHIIVQLKLTCATECLFSRHSAAGSFALHPEGHKVTQRKGTKGRAYEHFTLTTSKNVVFLSNTKYENKQKREPVQD